MTLSGDGIDYDVITFAIESIPQHMEGMTCEIGLRLGGGTKYIIEALGKSELPYKVHIGIDPYGHLPYQWREHVNVRMDYTNTMRDMIIGEIYKCGMDNNVNFIFKNMTDIEFFKRYSDGVPVYDEEAYLLSKYVFTYFDGPHDSKSLKTEFLWFNDRMESGATVVFDDVTFYDFEVLHPFIMENGWNILKFTQKKAAYQKI